MKKVSSQYTFFISLILTAYFLLTITIFYLSIATGNKGINISLFGGGDDGVGYYNEAVKFANDLPYLAPSIHVIVYGYILKIFNTEQVILLRLFNYLGYILLVVCALILFKKIISEKLFYWKLSIPLLIILMCYPSLILNTTMSLYRDIWIYFFFLWSIYLFSNIFIKKGKYPIVINILLLLLSMFMLFGYRKYALMSFIIGSGIYLILQVGKKKKFNLMSVFIIVFTGFSIFYIFLKDFKIPFIDLSFNDVLNYRQSFIDIYSGGSQMNISLEQSNIIMFYLNYLYSFLSNVIGPFPWQVNNISTLAIMVTEGILFIFVIVILYKNRKAFTKLDNYLLIQGLIWFMLISISNDNFGAGSRLRIVGWLPLLILFAKYFGENILLKRRK